MITASVFPRRTKASPEDGILPCTRCGDCCKSTLCHVGELAFGKNQAPPCPALVFREGLSSCLFVETEAESDLPKLIAEGLGIGIGCTCCDKYGITEEVFDRLILKVARVQGLTPDTEWDLD